MMAVAVVLSQNWQIEGQLEDEEELLRGVERC